MRRDRILFADVLSWGMLYLSSDGRDVQLAGWFARLDIAKARYI